MKKKGYGMFGKTVAYILLILSLICIPVGAVGTYHMAKEGFYIVSDTRTIRDEYLDSYFYSLGMNLMERAVVINVENANKYIEDSCIYYRVITPLGENIGNYRDDIAIEWSREYAYTYEQNRLHSFDGMEDYKIQMIVPVHKTYPDYVALICFVTKHLEWLRIVAPAAALVGLIVGIGSFVYLMCAAGWSRRKGEQTSGVFGKMPTDVFLIICVILVAFFAAGIRGRSQSTIAIIQKCLDVVGMVHVLLFGLMSIAARIKAGTFFKHSIIGFLYEWIKKYGKKVFAIYCKLPVFWIIVITVVVLTMAENWLIPVVRSSVVSTKFYLYFSWILLLEKIILASILLYFAYKLRSLYIAGQRLAEGNTSYKVDTTRLLGDMKTHGENLNSISEGVVKAVNERIKSEHFKTELITNVSHDIKTPLTSIINYSDLLYKEETDNEKIKEYSEVLYRQSGKLKKLIEDLVDASKASTGNIEVNLQPCDVGVLLTQAAGEFEQRLYEKSIDLISKQPDTSVQIMADPKLLWRVFDNLMNNICKYSQNGTRVYLAVEETADKAIISFKNISAYPLDIDAEELMERFVRGDRSRHTEGNGLGLNIAKSLIELQNGTLDLMIDGDLFKVLLSFPPNR